MPAFISGSRMAWKTMAELSFVHEGLMGAAIAALQARIGMMFND
jgi:hypothetical protein